MGNTFGRQVHETTGRPIMVTADGQPDWKAGGITIDWSTVAAVSGSDVTTPDGRVVKIGEKYLRYGQVLNRITASGKYGPADTTLSNGQETTGGGSQSFILNETVLEADSGSDHPAVFDGGLVWPDRIIAGSGNAPTLAAVLAALPRLSFAKD